MEVAKRAMESRDIAKAHNHIVLAEKLLGELRGILPEGTTAKDVLTPLYDNIINTLFISNITKDGSILDDSIAAMKIWINKWKIVVDESRDSRI